MTDQIFRIPPYALTAPCAPQTGPLRGSLRVDVALVGAGFSGCIAALELSRRGLSVALIDYLRPEMKFEGLDALIRQMDADSDTARAILKALP